MSEGIIKTEPGCSSRQDNSHGLVGSSGRSVARESSASSGSKQGRSQSASKILSPRAIFIYKQTRILIIFLLLFPEQIIFRLSVSVKLLVIVDE